MKSFQYYYYRLFKYFADGSDIPIFKAFAVIFIFALFNVLTVCAVISLFFVDEKIIMPQSENRFWLLILVIPCYGIYYYYLRILDKHEYILNKFSNETIEKRNLNGFRIIGYLIASIVLFVLSLWLRQKIRGY